MLISMEVYIDYICPWCFIAKRTVESVMDAFVKKHPEVEFEVTWRPFYLDPLFGRGESMFSSQYLYLSDINFTNTFYRSRQA